EKTDSNSISFSGDKLDSISKNHGIGGSVRVLHKGRWTFNSFNNISIEFTK
ncbi:MAG: PmbA/TldA metallopeptidase domain 1, partial [Cyanobacteriota bacterium]